MGIRYTLAMVAALLVYRIMQLLWLEPTLLAAMRDSLFISNMRLNWIIEENEYNKKVDANEPDAPPPLPLTIQLLGSIDDVVGPNDSLDLVSGTRFVYLDVKHSGHVNIVEMQGDDSPERDRRKAFLKAMSSSPDKLGDFQVRPWELEMPSQEVIEQRKKVEQVIFVIHGIRDEGYWTDKLARRVWHKADNPKPEKVTATYGYFGMGPFLIPHLRREKVAWLIERYIEAKAKWPNAAFSYIGHSHGTYVLAKALELLPKMQFGNVVFAGSVVRENYDWQALLGKQVSRVWNLAATKDWVVALFPRLFSQYGIQDLGGAGHNGFIQAKEQGPVYPHRYVKGAHGAGTKEELWDALADFVLRKGAHSDKETAPTLPTGAHAERRVTWLTLASPLTVVLWAALLIVVVGVIPTLILRYGSRAAYGLFSAVKSAISDHTLLLSSVSLAIVAYVFVRFLVSQEATVSPVRWAKSLLLFPIAAVASTSFVFFVLDKLAFEWGVELTPQSFGAALVVLWFVLVFWLLRRI